MQLALNKLSRKVVCPTLTDMQSLKQICMCVQGALHRRLILEPQQREEVLLLDTFVDAD